MLKIIYTGEKICQRLNFRRNIQHRILFWIDWLHTHTGLHSLSIFTAHSNDVSRVSRMITNYFQNDNYYFTLYPVSVRLLWQETDSFSKLKLSSISMYLFWKSKFWLNFSKSIYNALSQNLWIMYSIFFKRLVWNL